MGQYWKPVNLDKKEFLHAHKLGDGLKLIEIAYSSHGVMAAVALLLAPLPDGPRGGGDPRSRDPMIGRWAGDRIIFVGDYSEDTDAPHIPDFGGLYGRLDDEYTDISEMCIAMVAGTAAVLR